MEQLEIKRFVIGHDVFSVIRISESAIVVNRGQNMYAGFIRDFRTQLTKVSKWDSARERMMNVKQEEALMHYQLNMTKIVEVVRKMVVANG